MTLGPVGQKITEKLTQALRPAALSVRDDSHRHVGHGGWRPEGETHFHIEVVAEAFAGKTPLERHRMVNRILAEELADRVHALAITARAPAADG